jgi:hypothetical protein
VLVDVVIGDINVSNAPFHDAAVAAVTAATLPMEHEAMLLNDRDEYGERALYAWHST